MIQESAGITKNGIGDTMYCKSEDGLLNYLRMQKDKEKVKRTVKDKLQIEEHT